jgi:hypothetical protein
MEFDGRIIGNGVSFLFFSFSTVIQVLHVFINMGMFQRHVSRLPFNNAIVPRGVEQSNMILLTKRLGPKNVHVQVPM